MIRRIPVLATIIVVAAIALMVGLGLWQLQRAKWKEGLIARYAAADRLPPIAYPTVPLRSSELPLFRHATGVCLRIIGQRAIGGENRAGEPGYAQIVDCATGAEGPGMSVELGWSRNPNAKINWAGGPVSGVIAPDRFHRMRLVAASAPPGLEPSKVPNVTSISPITPAGHRGYAWTWFGLAAIALVTYVLAVSKRMKQAPK
ncbi:MAG TPA: SURF1 family protein [Sphingomicrobium sp.]|jgi:cytochrome oxidase assembly protein ShyY1